MGGRRWGLGFDTTVGSNACPSHTRYRLLQLHVPYTCLLAIAIRVPAQCLAVCGQPSLLPPQPLPDRCQTLQVRRLVGQRRCSALCNARWNAPCHASRYRCNAWWFSVVNYRVHSTVHNTAHSMVHYIAIAPPGCSAAAAAGRGRPPALHRCIT